MATSDANAIPSLLATSARLDSWWKLLADVSPQHHGQVVSSLPYSLAWL